MPRTYPPIERMQRCIAHPRRSPSRCLASFSSGRPRRRPQTEHVHRAPETIAANDNRRSAGTLKNGVLTVQLEARNGTWYPEGEHGVGTATAAWAEVGRPLENPGPVIRAAVGTVVRASIHNALAKPLTVYGFAATRGVKDSIVIAPGATREASFTPRRQERITTPDRQCPVPSRRASTKTRSSTGRSSSFRRARSCRPTASSSSRGGSFSIRRAAAVWVAPRWRSTDSHGRNGRLDVVQNDSVHGA